MNSEKLIHFLQSTGQINPQKAVEIASHFSSRSLSKNEFFLQAGKVSNEYLFLDKGFIRAFAFDTEENEVTTGFYGAGQVAFEVSSFFNRTPSQENMQALTDCECWSITFQELNNLFHAMPEFREFGRGVLVRGFASLKMRMLSMITQTAEERYANLLKNQSEILQQAPLKHIASYLGITDTSLSRIRKEFARHENVV